ncbi:hypothetical protein SAMCFNEI73_pA0118 (plasmid) [Sinorhizobium americanum]|uniref:Uncharacterized protein n=1 Tax=Sinorhizobium americanum TaxID=194963 RepID=A0A1L3LSP0_9HYPH|nr:hypothetical protein SAMCFNEI73_pA0118 [Sinorhizobium americanum]
MGGATKIFPFFSNGLNAQISFHFVSYRAFSLNQWFYARNAT